MNSKARRWRPWVAIVVLIGAMASFYMWSALTSANTNDTTRTPGGYYQQLTTSLLDGRLDINLPGPEESASREALRKLEDPYDPNQNWPYRMHDASWLDGNYFLYFGITPAIALMVPLRLVGITIGEPMAAALFASAGFALLLLSLVTAIRRFAPNVGFGLIWASGAVAGLVNGVPFLLRRPEVYETAIAAGLCFSMATLFMSLMAVLKHEHAPLWLAGAGVSVALAIGSRPHLALTALLPSFAIWRLSRLRGGLRGGDFLAFSAPLVLGLILLSAYNIARFGSPLEFGQTFQLAGENPQTYDRFSLARLIPGAFFYFLAPPSFSTVFPFVTLSPEWPGGGLPSSYTALEATGGVLVTTPVLIMIPVALMILVVRKTGSEAAQWTVLGALTALLIAAVPILTFGAATQRYSVDWLSLLAFAAALGVAASIGATRRRSTRGVLITGAAVLAAYSVMVGVALGMTGYYDAFRRGAPAQYRFIEDRLAVVPALAARISGAPRLQRARDNGNGTYEIDMATWPAKEVVTLQIPIHNPAGAVVAVAATNDRSGAAVSWEGRGPVASLRPVLYRGLNRMTITTAGGQGGSNSTPDGVTLDINHVYVER